MSKRNKKVSTPNLPAEALERARRQARGEDVDAQAARQKPPKAETPPAVPATPAVEKQPVAVKNVTPRDQTATPRSRIDTPAPATVRRTSSTTPARPQVRRRDGPMDNEMMERLLANPTKHVSEEELHQAYGYVLRDLRNMGLLAASLFVVLVVLAQFI